MRPTIFVLFGATGDLARRMVLPAFAARVRARRDGGAYDDEGPTVTPLHEVPRPQEEARPD